MRVLIAALAMAVAGCSASGAEISDTLDTIDVPTTTSLGTTATSSTTASTSRLAPRDAELVDPDFVGIWPYRTAHEVLDAAADGTSIDEVALIEAFLAELVGWQLGELIEGTDGTDRMGFTFQSTGGTFYAATQIVGYSPDGSAVVAIAHASSLDSLEGGWGPAIDIGESEEGWSAIVGATPIHELTTLPGVTGPFAQISYGEWQSELVPIGLDGASIAIPLEPTVPGVLSIWYFTSSGDTAGFSILALPPGPLAAD